MDPSSLYAVSAVSWLHCAEYARRQYIDLLGITGEKLSPATHAKLDTLLDLVLEDMDNAYKCWGLAGNDRASLYPYVIQSHGVTPREPDSCGL